MNSPARIDGFKILLIPSKDGFPYAQACLIPSAMDEDQADGILARVTADLNRESEEDWDWEEFVARMEPHGFLFLPSSKSKTTWDHDDTTPIQGEAQLPQRPSPLKVATTLLDADEEGGSLGLTADFQPLGLTLAFPGYGTAGMAEGHGWPVAVEVYKKELRVLVWGDINQEDPTHIISLEGALESNRRP